MHGPGRDLRRGFGPLPSGGGIEGGDAVGEGLGVRPQVLLVNDIVRADDERHDAGVAVMGDRSDELLPPFGRNATCARRQATSRR